LPLLIKRCFTGWVNNFNHVVVLTGRRQARDSSLGRRNNKQRQRRKSRRRCFERYMPRELSLMSEPWINGIIKRMVQDIPNAS